MSRAELLAAVRAVISNAYYDARNEGRTMEDAADIAAAGVLEATQEDEVATRIAEIRRLLDEATINPLDAYAEGFRFGSLSALDDVIDILAARDGGRIDVAHHPSLTGEAWDHWHAKVCRIGNSLCSAHQPGAWPHLVADALAQEERPGRAMRCDLSVPHHPHAGCPGIARTE